MHVCMCVYEVCSQVYVQNCMPFCPTGQRKASGVLLFHSPPRSFEKYPTVHEDPDFWIGWQTENVSNSSISAYLTGYRV